MVVKRKLLYSLIIYLLYLSFCNCSSRPTNVINSALDQTAEFFGNLKIKYAHHLPSRGTIKRINNEIELYIQNETRLDNGRERRQIKQDKGINTLEEFGNPFHVTDPDTQDVTFFSLQAESNLLWFVAILNIKTVSLYQLNKDISTGTYQRHYITAYQQKNNVKIVADSSHFGTIFVIQKHDGSVILKLNRTQNTLEWVQDLKIPGIAHIETWHGMNRLHLGIATDSKVLIYDWVGTNFDLVETLQFGAKKLRVLQSNGFIYLFALSTENVVLKYTLRFNKFLITQRLPSSQDINVFHLSKGRSLENFLCSSHNSSTILYKEMYDRFVPFQKLPSAKKTVSLTTAETVLLCSLSKDVLTVYQYDGWRFVQLNTKIFGVDNIRRIKVFDEDRLLIKFKDGTWKVKSPLWKRVKSWQNLERDLKSWCLDSKRNFDKRTTLIPEVKEPIKILNGFIAQLSIRKINNKIAEELSSLTKQYKTMIATLATANKMLSKINVSKPIKVMKLHAKKVQVQCPAVCKVSRMTVEKEGTFLAKIRNMRNRKHSLRFRDIRVKHLNNWQCPSPGFVIENMHVNQSNGRSLLNSLQENAMKIVGDQEITGTHVYTHLNVTKASVPLHISAYSIKQQVQANHVITERLNLKGSDLLLPLNGSLTTITGSITARNVILRRSVDLHAGFKGINIKKIRPISYVSDPLILTGDYIINYVEIDHELKVKDFFRPQNKSLNEILLTGLSLNSNISTHLLLTTKNVEWTNVTLIHRPNWITAYSDDEISISGVKFVPRDVVLTHSKQFSLPLPKLNNDVCIGRSIIPETILSVINIDSVSAITLKNLNAFQADELNDSLFSIAHTPEDINLSAKRFVKKVTVGEIWTSNITKINTTVLERIGNQWIDVNHFNGSINVRNLSVHILSPPVTFHLTLPTVIRNMVSKGNTYVGQLNNIVFNSFVSAVVKMEHMHSLGNITFNNVTSNNIHALQHAENIDRNFVLKSNLGSKAIMENLEVQKINVPYSFDYTKLNTPDYIIQGEVTYLREPSIRNVNNINLEELLRKIWLTTNSTFLSGSNINFENIILQEHIDLHGLPFANSFGPWTNISHKLFSKTQTQNISTTSSLNTVRTGNVESTAASMLNSSVLSLNDLLTKALRNNTSESVNIGWKFEHLISTGSMKVNSKINDMNLTTDVVRHDVKKNIITQKKTVNEINVRNLNGLQDFSRFLKTALMSNQPELAIIKGRKTFDRVTIDKLNLEGSIMGSSVKNPLLKSSKQEVSAVKQIKGFVKTSFLYVDSNINDVNLTNLVEHQLKKRKPIQRLKSRIILRDNLAIFGNLTVNRFYKGVKLQDMNMESRTLNVTMEKISKLVELTAGINYTLQNHAVYVNKLKSVDNPMADANEKFNRNIFIRKDKEQCKIANNSLQCDDMIIKNASSIVKTNNILLLKWIPFGNVGFIVKTTSNSTEIYKVDEESKFQQVTELYLPGTIEASAEATTNAIYIVTRSSWRLLIVRYALWGSLKLYSLPYSDTFVIDKVLHNQLLLLHSNGIWNLDELAGPEYIFKVDLTGEIGTYNDHDNYFVVRTNGNSTTLSKVGYIGV